MATRVPCRVFKKIIMVVSLVAGIALLCYSIWVSQSFMYMIALKNVQEHLNAAAYIETRQLLDKNFRSKFSYVVYATLCAGFLLLACAGFTKDWWLFGAAAFSLLCAIGDIIITLKGNMPLNNHINSWTVQQHPADWKVYRKKWLRYFYYRQWLSITGFTGLLAGVVFR